MAVGLRVGLAVAFVALVTLLLLPLHLVALRTGWIGPSRLPRLWHRIAARAIGLKVTTVGKLAPERPLMLVANHVSWVDIVALGAVAELSFVAKSEMADWPVFGRLAKWQRSVFVERERRRTSGHQANEIATRMNAGDVIVLFAEGTTSDGNYVLPFKSTLFGATERARSGNPDGTVWVQPVSLAYTRLHGMPLSRGRRHVASWIGDAELVPHLVRFVMAGPVDAEIRFGEPIEYGEHGDRKMLARVTEAQVRAMLLASLSGRE